MAEVDVEMSSNGAAAGEEAAVTKGKQQAIAEDRPVNDRLLFCAEVLIGYRCTVEVSCCGAQACTPHARRFLAQGTNQNCNSRVLWFLQLVDGTIYEGIFHTMKVDGRHTHVVLKYAKVAREASSTAEDMQGIAKKPELVKVFHSDDIAAVVAKDVRMSPEDLGAEAYDLGFETDAAISRGRGGYVLCVALQAFNAAVIMRLTASSSVSSRKR
jgi:hypothetical protein